MLRAFLIERRDKMKRFDDIPRKAGSFIAVMTILAVVLCALALLVSATIKICYWLVEPVFAYEVETPVAVVEEVAEVEPVEIVPEEPEPLTVEERFGVTEYEIQLLALVTMAEAEGECEEGKRLVIDTVLNRVDSEYFPDTIENVIYQPNQFESMWNGRVSRCEVLDEYCQLVREELENRTNSDVVFFTAGQYGEYGEPLMQVGNHYFSTY